MKCFYVVGKPAFRFNFYFKPLALDARHLSLGI